MKQIKLNMYPNLLKMIFDTRELNKFLKIMLDDVQFKTLIE